VIRGMKTERIDDKGRTTERDGKETQRSVRGKYTKRKMQEGILNDRSESKYAHVLLVKSRPAVRI
jgi:hypothetical protein